MSTLNTSDHEKLWNAVSKLESQVSRNADLPPIYKVIVSDAFEVLNRIKTVDWIETPATLTHKQAEQIWPNPSPSVERPQSCSIFGTSANHAVAAQAKAAREAHEELHRLTRDVTNSSPEAERVGQAARVWRYPVDEPLPCSESVELPEQTLVISANPTDEEYPWGVIAEDRETMYDVAEILIEVPAFGKADWSADNYWLPKMWIECRGVLKISGTKATIAQPALAAEMVERLRNLAQSWRESTTTMSLTPMAVTLESCAEQIESILAAARPPSTEAGAPVYPFPLSEAQQKVIEMWAADTKVGDVWGSAETRRLNLTAFARSILAATKGIKK